MSEFMTDLATIDDLMRKAATESAARTDITYYSYTHTSAFLEYVRTGRNGDNLTQSDVSQAYKMRRDATGESNAENEPVSLVKQAA